VNAAATLERHPAPMSQKISDCHAWQCELERGTLAGGVHPPTMSVAGKHGQASRNGITADHVASACTAPRRAALDQDNAVEAWPERGLPGTQPCRHKNERKW
jgi:Icc protein